MRMAGKVVVVTGSTSGIGKAIARCCAKEGAKVVVSGRSAARGEAVAAEIKKDGGDAVFIGADIGNEDDVRGLVAKAVGHYGKLTTLINNAAPTEMLGTQQDHPVDQHNTDSWDKMLRLCLTSVMWASKYAVPELRKAGGGAIIHIGSAVAFRGGEEIAGYSAAKGALMSLTRSMAGKYGPERITVNCIHPGFFAGDKEFLKTLEPFATTMKNGQMLPQWGETEDIGWACVWLASNEGKFVTGTNIPVDGGASAKSPGG